MKSPSLFLFAALCGIFFTSCTSNGKIELGGAPAWIAGGAKLDGEPDPVKPDPALIEYEDEDGPVEFRIITDKRTYREPSPTRRSSNSKPTRDPIEPGRDYRIKRLFR